MVGIEGDLASGLGVAGLGICGEKLNPDGVELEGAAWADGYWNVLLPVGIDAGADIGLGRRAITASSFAVISNFSLRCLSLDLVRAAVALRSRASISLSPCSRSFMSSLRCLACSSINACICAILTSCPSVSDFRCCACVFLYSANRASNWGLTLVSSIDFPRTLR